MQTALGAGVPTKVGHCRRKEVGVKTVENATMPRNEGPSILAQDCFANGMAGLAFSTEMNSLPSKGVSTLPGVSAACVSPKQCKRQTMNKPES